MKQQEVRALLAFLEANECETGNKNRFQMLVNELRRGAEGTNYFHSFINVAMKEESEKGRLFHLEALWCDDSWHFGFDSISSLREKNLAKSIQLIKVKLENELIRKFLEEKNTKLLNKSWLVSDYQVIKQQRQAAKEKMLETFVSKARKKQLGLKL